MTRGNIEDCLSPENFCNRLYSTAKAQAEDPPYIHPTHPDPKKFLDHFTDSEPWSSQPPLHAEALFRGHSPERGETASEDTAVDGRKTTGIRGFYLLLQVRQRRYKSAKLKPYTFS